MRGAVLNSVTEDPPLTLRARCLLGARSMPDATMLGGRFTSYIVFLDSCLLHSVVPVCLLPGILPSSKVDQTRPGASRLHWRTPTFCPCHAPSQQAHLLPAYSVSTFLLWAPAEHPRHHASLPSPMTCERFMFYVFSACMLFICFPVCHLYQAVNLT